MDGLCVLTELFERLRDLQVVLVVEVFAVELRLDFDRNRHPGPCVAVAATVSLPPRRFEEVVGLVPVLVEEAVVVKERIERLYPALLTELVDDLIHVENVELPSAGTDVRLALGPELLFGQDVPDDVDPGQFLEDRDRGFDGRNPGVLDGPMLIEDPSNCRQSISASSYSLSGIASSPSLPSVLVPPSLPPLEPSLPLPSEPSPPRVQPARPLSSPTPVAFRNVRLLELVMPVCLVTTELPMHNKGNHL